MPIATRLTCLAASLLLSVGAAAQVPDDATAVQDDDSAQAAQAFTAYRARIATTLAANGDARSLAIAALLLPSADGAQQTDAMPGDDAPSQDVPVDPRGAQWRQQAAARTGGDVLVDVLLASTGIAGATDAASRRAAAERWLRAEPDNLAPRLALADDAATVLDATNGPARFDLHYLEQARALTAALRAHPPTDPERASFAPADAPPDEVAAISAAAMVSMPGSLPLKSLFDACGPQALQATPARADGCRRVADAMRERSDTAFGESLGLSLTRRIATMPDAIAAVDAAGRVYAWRVQQFARINGRLPRNGAALYVRLLADPAIVREQQIAERALRGADIPLTPPEGWQPPPRE